MDKAWIEGLEPAYPGIAVLGDLEVIAAGEQRKPTTRQVARVASALATSPGRTVPRDSLIETLWGATPPKTAVNTLQVHISQLRSLCGPSVIQTTASGYLLDIPASNVDAEWFRLTVPASVAALAAGANDQALRLVQRALEVWRGSPFIALDTPSIFSIRTGLQELYERALEVRAEASLALTDSAAARSAVIADLKELVSRQPLRERGHELLIRALVADDRLPEAGAAYREAERLFNERAGVQPSRRLKEALGNAEKIMN